MSSHIRRANDRTPAQKKQQMVRRSYNYDLGVDDNGNMQSGHIFTCFQADVKAQFEEVQRRLIAEPLVDYVEPFGGGYFFVPPAARKSGEYVGQQIFA